MRALEDWRHFPGRCPPQGRNLDGPQEPGVLHDGKETQPSSGSVVPLPIQIRLLHASPTGTFYGQVRRSISQSGPWYRSGGQQQCHATPSGVLCSSRNPSPLRTVIGRRRARTNPSGYSQGNREGKQEDAVAKSATELRRSKGKSLRASEWSERDASSVSGMSLCA